jgi:threonylcarbamoyladenosine tRNA methylthiotransferase MtaB
VPEVLVSPCATDLPDAIRPLDRFPNHTRAFLKIQDGCNAFCSYCIVPYARGRSRSLAPAQVLERLARLARRGFQEVVLTGIHLGAYGQDQHPPTDLAGLLRAIEAERPVERLRLSSIEPREITDGLLAVFADAQTICPHLHIPLQSGDDRILGLMNRNYDRNFFSDTVRRILSARPETALGLDVMAGFPGEDEGAFQKTCELIESLPIAYLHVFPFSRSPGTRAAEMGLQVRAEEKKDRASRLRLLGDQKRLAFMERFVGRPLQVLVEGGCMRTTGDLRGFSEHYLPVALSGREPELVNRGGPVVARGIARGMLQAEGQCHG